MALGLISFFINKNDSGEGERPIMQIVYSLRWSDAGLNYGEEQLFDG